MSAASWKLRTLSEGCCPTSVSECCKTSVSRCFSDFRTAQRYCLAILPSTNGMSFLAPSSWLLVILLPWHIQLSVSTIVSLDANDAADDVLIALRVANARLPSSACTTSSTSAFQLATNVSKPDLHLGSNGTLDVFKIVLRGRCKGTTSFECWFRRIL